MDRHIILASAGLVHPPLPARVRLQRMLNAMPGFHLQHIRSLEALPQLDLDRFHAIVLYFHRRSISPPAVNALADFADRGGGLLALHSATASFRDSPRYGEILGGRFSGHGPVETFQVRPSRPQDEVFGSMEAFEVTDELYLHDLAADIEVHFHALHEGQPVPMVWTRNHGAGRVCYVCPGHRTATLGHPSMQEILRRGLAWVCGS